MLEGMNERQRQRFVLLGESQAKAIVDALADEGIEPALANPAALEAVRAWLTGWGGLLGISFDELDARFAHEIAVRMQFEQPRCKPA
jgi:hypothetical protein